MKGHILFSFFLLGSSYLFGVSFQQLPKMCPLGWKQFNSSCYFSGERFNGQTFYSATAFCLGLKAHLVEINSGAELDYLRSEAEQIDWVDGPWVGLMRPFGDNRWILPSTKMESMDLDLNKLLEEIAQQSTHDCAGFDKRGKNFGFWRCRNGGSPWCEIEQQ